MSAAVLPFCRPSRPADARGLSPRERRALELHTAAGLEAFWPWADWLACYRGQTCPAMRSGMTRGLYQWDARRRHAEATGA
jgi:hypothetical protein